MTTIKTRFCPSPTGYVHLGNLRTALFNALLARPNQGIFLLRIEDTDQERSKAIYTEALLADLRWLDLQWQEGPEHDRGLGPYWQAQRQPIYDQYYQQLQDMRMAYPCFCTEQQLAISRKNQRRAGKPPRYAGTCYKLSEAEIKEKFAQGLQPTLRFHVAENQKVVFQDLVKGEQSFNTMDMGDFIIRRTDGTAPFMFANAIDDALMQVTHALRGEDHLTNTPRQILILKTLGLPQPQYGHIPLIVGQDGSPLSKRHGSRSVRELRAQGFLPLAINNYLARLGHRYENENLLSMDELAQNFSIRNIGRAPARFDENQLLYWQKIAVTQLNPQERWQWLEGAMRTTIPPQQHELFLETIAANVIFPPEAQHWAQIFFSNDFAVPTMHHDSLDRAGKIFWEHALAAVAEQGADFAAVSAMLQTKLGVKGKALFQPLRMALTGESHGPEMAKIFLLLGQEVVRARLLAALEVCK